VDSSSRSSPRILPAALRYWRDAARLHGRFAATRALVSTLWEFARDSTPWRRRQRYGDADYDWEHRVNTTSAAIGWRDRLLGVLNSPYQPTDAALFREMLDALRQHSHLNFADFTFLDLGSGKGRTLLMASNYAFRRIIGVELLPALDRIARENLDRYKSESQQCFSLEAVCADATTFPLPSSPLVIYLFNPFPESGLRKVVANLHLSLRTQPREVYLLYHNPLLEHVLNECGFLDKIAATHQYSVFRGVDGGQDR